MPLSATFWSHWCKMRKPAVNKIKSVLSPQGREIAFYEYKSKQPRGNLFLLGGFHGDEPEGMFVIDKMREDLPAAGKEFPYNIYLLPCLNPDGKALNTRQNANQVDLNRNFPTADFQAETVNPHTGKASAGSPASELETRFMMELVEHYQPVRILSIHSDLHLVDYDGPAREMALKMAEKTGYKFVENVGYPTSGSFGTWAGIEKQIALITLETWKAHTPEDFEKIRNELKEAIFDFCS